MANQEIRMDGGPFPSAFEARMRDYLHEDWNRFAAAHETSGPISVRINNKKKSTIYLDKESVPWTAYGRYLNERPLFTLDPLFHAGSYYVQEASSMFLEQAITQSVDLDQPLRVLDLCAAPGGKSTHLLSLLNTESLLVTNEVIRSRASILAENIQKWGCPNVVVTNSDPENFGSLTGFFDLIVVDAPCSGEGLFRKDPDAMKEWSTEHVNLCANRQKRILSHVWPALKQNGILIYCTCTFNAFENEKNLLWLKQEHHPEFLELKLRSSWGIDEVRSEDSIGYRFYPHKVKGEGFFISAMRKSAKEKEIRAKPTKKVFSQPTKKITDQVHSWIVSDSGYAFLQFRDTLLFLPESQANAVEFLSQYLHIVQTGTALGELKHEKIIPEHAAALSMLINKNAFQCLGVNLEDALRYLRKENLSPGDLKKGFALICFNEAPLGWVNVLDNRMNNLYPLNWRIRM